MTPFYAQMLYPLNRLFIPLEAKTYEEAVAAMDFLDLGPCGYVIVPARDVQGLAIRHQGIVLPDDFRLMPAPPSVFESASWEIFE